MNIFLPNYILVATLICLAVWTMAGLWFCYLIWSEAKRRDEHDRQQAKRRQEWKDQ